MSNTNPLLGPLANNGGPTQTFALLPGSPAIDAGNDAVCMAAVGAPDYGAGGFDQRGVTRPHGSHCDIGAFELDKFPIFLPLVKALEICFGSHILGNLGNLKCPSPAR